MKRTSEVLLVAMAAGMAASSIASGQVTTYANRELPDGTFTKMPVGHKRVRWNARPTGDGSLGGYGSRAITVLDNVTDLFGHPTESLLNTSHMLDDYSFNPGPWSSAVSRVVTSISPTHFVAQWDGTTSPAVNWRIKFYNAPAFATTVGASMIPAGATVAGDLVFELPAGWYDEVPPGPGAAYDFVYDDIELDTTPGAEDLKFTGSNFLVEVSLEDPANPNRYAWVPSGGATNPLGNAGMYIPAGENTTSPVLIYGLVSMRRPTSPGSTPDVGYGRDINLDGTFTYAPVVSGGGFTTPTDIRDYRNSSGTSYAMSLKGIASVAIPPIDVDLGCLNDGQTNTTVSGRAPGAFKTIKFCLKGDATDAQRRFLDIIGDNADGTDFSIGVYDSTGALVSVQASDDNSGDSSTGTPQMSFGIGRRAKFYSSGTPRDGRNGELIAGTYYALVSGPAASFGDAFIVSVPDVSIDAGGSSVLHFQTNVNAGALTASDAPNPADYGGSTFTLPPSASLPSVQPLAYHLTWYSFDVCENISDAASGEFLDIDTGTSGIGADSQVMLFDSAGMLVAESDDSGTSNKAALSFSDASVAARTPAAAGMSPLAGQNGTLAAGTYYLAVGLSTITHAAAGDRFHVRATSGNSDGIAFNANTNIDCTEETGCPCVADFDGSGGTPDASDIDAFFGAWLLGDPAADSDCSGGTPDASDIDQFFNEWLAGGC